MSESPAAALLTSDTHHVKQQMTKTAAAPPTIRPVLLYWYIVHAIQLLRAGPAEIVTDSLRASVRTEYTSDDRPQLAISDETNLDGPSSSHLGVRPSQMTPSPEIGIRITHSGGARQVVACTVMAWA